MFSTTNYTVGWLGLRGIPPVRRVDHDEAVLRGGEAQLRQRLLLLQR